MNWLSDVVAFLVKGAIKLALVLFLLSVFLEKGPEVIRKFTQEFIGAVRSAT